MNKNIKKILLLLIMCTIILLIYKSIDIYAIFHSEMNGNVNFEKGKWNITINGADITTGTDVEFVIDEIDTAGNEFVKPGKIAPGLSGKFQIAIDPEDTNVSVKYDITLEQEKLGDTNMKIKSIKAVDEGYTLINTAENTYTGIMTLNEINEGITHTIEIEIEWIDDESANESDTEIGKSKEHKFQIPIKIHAIQYLGEEIVPMIIEE